MISLVVDRDDRIERRFEDGAFSGLGLGQRRPQARALVGSAMDERPGRWAGRLRSTSARNILVIDVDELAGLHVAQAGCGLPNGRSC